MAMRIRLLILVMVGGLVVMLVGCFSGEPVLKLPSIPGLDFSKASGSITRMKPNSEPQQLLSQPVKITAPSEAWAVRIFSILPDYQGAVASIDFDTEWSDRNSFQVGVANYQTHEWEMLEVNSGGAHTLTLDPLSSYRSWNGGGEDEKTYLVFAVPPGETLTVNSIQTNQRRLYEHVPPGFVANRFLSLSGSRDIWTDSRTGVTYVMRRSGSGWEVWWMQDDNGDGKVTTGDKEAGILISGSGKAAHGVTVYGNAREGYFLYAGVFDTIYRVKLSANGRSPQGSLETWLTGLPAGRGHTAKSIRFDSSGNAYIGVGSSGNISTEQNRAAIYRVPAGSNRAKIWVRGIRNPTALLIEGKDLLVFSVERDRLGNEKPVEPLYRIPLSTPSGVDHFGYPWWMWDGVARDYVRDDRVGGAPIPLSADQIPFAPEAWIPAHNTPLGMVHANETNFPAPWNKGIFVAARGSWNSDVRTGYRVFYIDDGQTIPFTGMFLNANSLLFKNLVGGWFRPVSVAAAADGSLLVTGDAISGPVKPGEGFRGIYRISYDQTPYLTISP
ncbi:MAG: hypothetical protein GXO98_01140 [Nitrospirae bacterium]|nr:hypothetical protein [Nitrospirota bacterium]